MELLNEIWATVSRNKMRTALTGFAVAWGIFMLIFLLGAGNGLIHALSQSFDAHIDNSMMVYGGYTSKPYKGLQEGRPVTLKDADLGTTVRSFSRNVDDAGAQAGPVTVTIVLGDRYTDISLTGVYPNSAHINKLQMRYGRFLNEIDMRERRKSLVISDTQARELTRGDLSRLVGREVKAGSFAFRIVGIYRDSRNSLDAGTYIPFTTYRTLYQKGTDVSNIEFSFHGLQTAADNEAFEQQYRARLNRNHQAAPDDENSIWIWNRFTQAMTMQSGIGIIRTALWVVGLFTLLSGIVGVSNIMLITVKERTREFGIRKAIGAKPRDILKLIIAESVAITTFFGYIGMMLGMAANHYMDLTLGHQQTDTGLFRVSMFVDPTVGLGVCLQATAVMVLAGTLAGLIPATKAARIRPIEALQSE